MLVVAPIGIMFGLDMVSAGIMNRRARKITGSKINLMMFTRLFITGLFMAAMARYLFPIGKTTYGSSQIGRILSLETLLVMDNPNGDRNIKIICNF